MLCRAAFTLPHGFSLDPQSIPSSVEVVEIKTSEQISSSLRGSPSYIGRMQEEREEGQEEVEEVEVKREERMEAEEVLVPAYASLSMRLSPVTNARK